MSEFENQTARAEETRAASGRRYAEPPPTEKEWHVGDSFRHPAMSREAEEAEYGANFVEVVSPEEAFPGSGKASETVERELTNITSFFNGDRSFFNGSGIFHSPVGRIFAAVFIVIGMTYATNYFVKLVKDAEAELNSAGSNSYSASPLIGTPLGAEQFTSREIDDFKQFAATELKEFVVPATDGENTLEVFYDLPRGEWVEFRAIITTDFEIKLLYKSSSIKDLPEQKAKAASDMLSKKLDKLVKQYLKQRRLERAQPLKIYAPARD